MSVKIIDSIVPISSKVRTGTVKQKRWIVIHETGNKSKGADAENHAKYLQNLAKSNNKYLSWHYTVDDHEIYHHIPDNEIAWHAGDGEKEGGGNYAGIGIEICVNADGDFAKARNNAAWLTAKLLKDFNLPVSAVKQHHDFSNYGKNCPETIRNQGLWGEFIETVSNYLGETKTPQIADLSGSALKYKVGDKVLYSSCYRSSTAPQAEAIIYKSFKTGTITKILTNGCHNPYLIGNGTCWVNDGDIRGYADTVIYFPACNPAHTSISEALKSVGADGSFSNRAKIAAKNGISNYIGTAAQNIEMLTLLKQGKLKK